MAVIEYGKIANDGLVEAAKLGAMAAMNAPQITETVNIKVSIVTGREEILPMVQYLRIKAPDSFVNYGEYRTLAKLYEADTLPTILIVGAANLNQCELNWNCGACGFATCDEFNKFSQEARGDVGAFGYGGGPFCNWKILDATMAYDMACAALADCSVESRPQASTGQAGMAFGYVEGCEWVSGIVIGPSGGRQVWFNRPSLRDSFNDKDVIEHLQRALPSHFLAFPGTGDPKVKWGPNWEADPKYWRYQSPPAEWFASSDKKAKQILDLITKVKAERAKREGK